MFPLICFCGNCNFVITVGCFPLQNQGYPGARSQKYNLNNRLHFDFVSFLLHLHLSVLGYVVDGW